MTMAPSKPSALKVFGNNEVEIPEGMSIIQEGQEIPNDKILWRVISEKDGDTRIVWDAMSIPEINDAKGLFDDMVSKGMQPHRVEQGGQTSPAIMGAFDPTAEEIIFLPLRAIAGG